MADRLQLRGDVVSNHAQKSGEAVHPEERVRDDKEGTFPLDLLADEDERVRGSALWWGAAFEVDTLTVVARTEDQGGEVEGIYPQADLGGEGEE